MCAEQVLINLLGCAWLFTAHMEGAEQSWLVDVGMLSSLCIAWLCLYDYDANASGPQRRILNHG